MPAPLPSLRPPRLDDPDRAEIAAYFDNAWALYEWLFSSITGRGALYRQPDPLRHPLIFYLGHTAAFYVNKLRLAGLRSSGIHEEFERLFEMGVDPATADELEGHDDWPAEQQVRDYRRRVYGEVRGFIEGAPLDRPIAPDHPLWALMMGIEHDRIHFETSSALIRQYASDDVTRPRGWEYAPSGGSAPANRMLPVTAGEVRVGKPRGLPTFGWDNEYGERRVEVAPFEAERPLVTNGDFLAFVEEGGYADDRLWSDEGRTWRRESGQRAPRFWVERSGGWAYRAMFDELPFPEAWPVEVNAHEARAYCAWRGDGCRLPTEAEFLRLAGERRRRDDDAMYEDDFNLHLRFGSPSAVGALPSAANEAGFQDVFGNVWSWLADDFRPLPGFRPHPYYADFSEPYFDDRHATMLGGSWATSGTGASQYYRLWFRRQFFQHAGFRIARDA